MTTQTKDIFSNVAAEDYLSFFSHTKPRYNRIVNFLEFKNEDVSHAAGVPVSSVRYDAKIPIELQQRIREWAVLLNLVAQHFKGDRMKTMLWFTTPNPLLGNISPRNMIRFGRFSKLHKFIVTALEENKR